MEEYISNKFLLYRKSNILQKITQIHKNFTIFLTSFIHFNSYLFLNHILIVRVQCQSQISLQRNDHLSISIHQTKTSIQQLPNVKFYSYRLSDLQKQFSTISKEQLSSTLIQKSLRLQSNFDLLCSIVLDIEGKILITQQKLSKIQQGLIQMNINNFEEKINFQKNNIKELKITTIISKDANLEDIKKQLMRITSVSKQKKYFNNQLVSLKSRVLSQSSDNNKQAKNQKKSSQIQKKNSNLVKKQQKQIIKPKQQSVKLNPLQRKTSKDLNNPKPAKITETPQLKFQSKPKQETKEEKNVRCLKMNIQSDEEYYQKNKFNNMLQMMDIEEDEKAKQTDSSGKKKDQFLSDHHKDININNFSAQSENNDSDDQDLFQKMDKIEVKNKTQPSQQKQSSPLSNTQLKPTQKINSSESIKPKPQVKKQTTPVTGGGLLGWLKPK